MTKTLTKQRGLYGAGVDDINAAVASADARVMLAEASGDAEALLAAHGELAIARDALAHHHIRLGRFRPARDVLNVGLADLPVELIPERLLLTNTLISVEFLLARYGRVLELSSRAVADAELMGDDYARAQAESNVAHALAVTGETDRAFERYTSAHHYFGVVGHRCHQAATDNNIGRLLVQTNRAEDAHFYFDRAADVYKAECRRAELGQVYESYAQAFLAGDQPRAAFDMIRLSLKNIPREERKKRSESYRTLGDIFARMDRKGWARAAYLKAMGLMGEEGEGE